MSFNSGEFRDPVVSSDHYVGNCGCSIVGVLITLLVIGVLLIIPAILGGNIIFLGTPNSVQFDPEFLVMLPYLILSVPLLLIVVFVSYLYSRRKDSEM